MRPGMVMLLGKSGGGATISISNMTITDEETSPSSATAYLTLESDGDTATHQGADADWLLGSTTGSNYEARATLVSGTLSSGTTGTWLALSSNLTWRVDRASLGTKACTFDLEIGLAGANTAIATARITLQAIVTV